MSQVPEKLDKIEHATLRAWLNRLRDSVMARTLVSAPGYRALRGAGGQYFSFDKKSAKAGSSGTSIKWAEVTAVTDANNYTCDIYADRNDSATETDKAVYVWDIADELSVGDFFPVQSSKITDVDYESIQQIGLL